MKLTLTILAFLLVVAPHVAVWLAFGVGQFLYLLKRAHFGGGPRVSVFSYIAHNAAAILYRLGILTGIVGGLLANPQWMVWAAGLFGASIQIPFATLPWYFALLIGLFGEAIIIDWLCQKSEKLRVEIPPLNGK